MARFEREVDPNNELPPEDRARRAEHAKKAYFTRLALKSAKARSAKAAGGKRDGSHHGAQNGGTDASAS